MKIKSLRNQLFVESSFNQGTKDWNKFLADCLETSNKISTVNDLHAFLTENSENLSQFKAVNKDKFNTLFDLITKQVYGKFQLYTGTWSLPLNETAVNRIVKILKNGIKANEAFAKLYNLLGDNELFDSIQKYKELAPNNNIAPEIVNWIIETNIGLDKPYFKQLQNKVKTDPDLSLLIYEKSGKLENISSELHESLKFMPEKDRYAYSIFLANRYKIQPKILHKEYINLYQQSNLLECSKVAEAAISLFGTIKKYKKRKVTLDENSLVKILLETAVKYNVNQTDLKNKFNQLFKKKTDELAKGNWAKRYFNESFNKPIINTNFSQTPQRLVTVYKALKSIFEADNVIEAHGTLDRAMSVIARKLSYINKLLPKRLLKEWMDLLKKSFGESMMHKIIAIQNAAQIIPNPTAGNIYHRILIDLEGIKFHDPKLIEFLFEHIEILETLATDLRAKYFHNGEFDRPVAVGESKFYVDESLAEPEWINQATCMLLSRCSEGEDWYQTCMNLAQQYSTESAAIAYKSAMEQLIQNAWKMGLIQKQELTDCGWLDSAITAVNTSTDQKAAIIQSANNYSQLHGCSPKAKQLAKIALDTHMWETKFVKKTLDEAAVYDFQKFKNNPPKKAKKPTNPTSKEVLENLASWARQYAINEIEVGTVKSNRDAVNMIDLIKERVADAFHKADPTRDQIDQWIEDFEHTFKEMYDIDLSVMIWNKLHPPGKKNESLTEAISYKTAKHCRNDLKRWFSKYIDSSEVALHSNFDSSTGENNISLKMTIHDRKEKTLEKLAEMLRKKLEKKNWKNIGGNVFKQGETLIRIIPKVYKTFRTGPNRTKESLTLGIEIIGPTKVRVD